jgi:hypothetical protein
VRKQCSRLRTGRPNQRKSSGSVLLSLRPCGGPCVRSEQNWLIAMSHRGTTCAALVQKRWHGKRRSTIQVCSRKRFRGGSDGQTPSLWRRGWQSQSWISSHSRFARDRAPPAITQTYRQGSQAFTPDGRRIRPLYIPPDCRPDRQSQCNPPEPLRGS